MVPALLANNVGHIDRDDAAGAALPDIADIRFTPLSSCFVARTAAVA
jgi:hypothetical protein